jgi:hypothetical protein
MKLELSFVKALQEPITVITYAKFPAMMEIDASRNVLL